MTFQWILAGINLILVMFEMSLALRFKRKERELRERESALKETAGKQFQQPPMNRNQKVTLKIDLDEIDIDKVKDGYTRNYLAMRKLLSNINLN